MILCTEWIQGKEFVYGEVVNSEIENLSFVNEINCYQVLKRFSGIADPINVITS